MNYLVNRTNLKSSHLSPTKVTLTYINEKPTFWPNLAVQKQKKWIFGQIWNYLIWPNMARDSHRTHLQYLISRFSGQLIKIIICFQPGVNCIYTLMNVLVLYSQYLPRQEDNMQWKPITQLIGNVVFMFGVIIFFFFRYLI